MFHLKLLTNLLSGYVVLSIFSIWGNWFRQSSNIEIPSLEYTSCGFLNDWGKISILRPKLILSLGVYPWWRRQWHPTPVLLPGKSHGWRSLVGCSPWGREESDTTERLHFHFSLSCIGEGNGNPLQCSCLENPRDGGAWWAAVYGVAQSRTRLKWLSSSSKYYWTFAC